MKTFLRIDTTSDDALLAVLLAAAKDDADAFLGNDFKNSDGVDQAVPSKVERWILQQVARDYENRPAGLTSQQIATLGQVAWAERDYAGIYSHWEPRV